MSNHATTFFSQGRSFLQAGNPARAVELLERAKVMAGDNAELQAEIWAALAEAYEGVGRLEDAHRAKDNAERYRIAAGPRAVQAPAFSRPVMRPPPKKRRSLASMWMMIGGAVALVVVVVGGIALFTGRKSNSTTSPADGGATAPTTAPATTQPTVSPLSAPTLLSSSPAAPTPGGEIDRQELLKQNVGMLVVFAQYEANISGSQLRFDMPLSIGTAFAVHTNGFMLTNKHVIESSNKRAEVDRRIKERVHPLLTYRKTNYVVCFGPLASDRFEARVVHTSPGFDMAVLKVDRAFIRPLVISAQESRQGNDIWVCGYPGVVNAFLDRAHNTPTRLQEIAQRWRDTGKFDALAEMSADAFDSTLTKGIVSAPHRQVDGVSYIQIDAAVSRGNSGGPVLNNQNEVVGILTLGISERGQISNYNFALQLDQLMSEVQANLKSD